MKKLVYVSADHFIDVDIPIVRELNKIYKLQWIIYYKTLSVPLFSMDDLQSFVKGSSIDLKLVPIDCRYRSPKLAVIAWNILKAIRKQKPDVIYFQPFNDPYMALMARILLPVKKVVAGIHDVVLHKKFGPFILSYVHSLSMRIYKNYHLYSENQKAIFQKKIKNKNILLARLYLKDFGRPSALIHKKNDEVNFLFFGSIRFNKGLEFLLEAGNLLANEFSNFKITVAGHTSDKEYYTSLIKHPERFETRFEAIPNAEVPDYFAKADFLVLPYRDVTQSGPLLIAYNYGVPVIGSDFPGFREYINHGETGFLFEPNNSEALYKVMKEILSQKTGYYAEIKKNLARYIDKEINLSTIIEQYVTFFDQLSDGQV